MWRTDNIQINALSTKQYLREQNRSSRWGVGNILSRQWVNLPTESKEIDEILFKLYKICIDLKLDHNAEVFHVDWERRILFKARVISSGKRYALADLCGYKV